MVPVVLYNAESSLNFRFSEPEFALPVSGLTQDLGVPEKSIRKLLEGLGCM